MGEGINKSSPVSKIVVLLLKLSVVLRALPVSPTQLIFPLCLNSTKRRRKKRRNEGGKEAGRKGGKKGKR